MDPVQKHTILHSDVYFFESPGKFEPVITPQFFWKENEFFLQQVDKPANYDIYNEYKKEDLKYGHIQ